MMISVIGAGETFSATLIRAAEEVGRELAERGAIVVCGGLKGVMEAVCKGAKAKGGVTIGILPDNDPLTANPWVDYAICTGMGYARNAIVVKSGRAVIAIGGAFGTLSEIGHALGDGIPVVALNTWSLTRNGEHDDSMTKASNPREAVEKAIKLAKQRMGIR